MNAPVFTPTQTPAELTQIFLAGRRKLKNDSRGENTHLDDFAFTARMIANNAKDFSYQDFLSLSRRFDNGDGSSVAAMEVLFADWTHFLKECKKLIAEVGCYDFCVYRWI